MSLAVNLDWHDLPLGPRLEARLGIPTVVENDVRAAALGLHRRRLFGPAESSRCSRSAPASPPVSCSTAQLHRGALGLAGEIGHVIIDPDGPRCACGNQGCFEAVAAGPAIVARTRAGWAARRRRARAGPERAEPSPAPKASSPPHAAGDPIATEVIESAGRAIAWGIHLLALAYDLERIVLGGGVSHAGEPFMAPIRRELDRYRAASPLAAEILDPSRVQLLPAGSDAGAWGAVTIAREALAGAADAAAAAGTARGREQTEGGGPRLSGPRSRAPRNPDHTGEASRGGAHEPTRPIMAIERRSNAHAETHEPGRDRRPGVLGLHAGAVGCADRRRGIQPARRDARAARRRPARMPSSPPRSPATTTARRSTSSPSGSMPREWRSTTASRRSATRRASTSCTPAPTNYETVL